MQWGDSLLTYLRTVDPVVKQALDEQIARAQQDNDNIKTQMAELKGEDQALIDEIESFRPRNVRLRTWYI